MSACLIEEEEGALGGLFHLAERFVGLALFQSYMCLYLNYMQTHALYCTDTK